MISPHGSHFLFIITILIDFRSPGFFSHQSLSTPRLAVLLLQGTRGHRGELHRDASCSMTITSLYHGHHQAAKKGKHFRLRHTQPTW
jgi:hypothetical protein